MALNKFEYEFWTVAQLQKQGLTPGFANSFNYFVRDVGKINVNAGNLEEIVGQNSLDIEQNSDNIQINVENIQINSDNIQTNTDNFNTHNMSDNEHGVTGDNVGTGDYCGELIGGVVNLAALITDLNQITTTDITPAPTMYNSTYIDTIATLTNENKAKINEIVTKINELLAGQITAKQMSNV